MLHILWINEEASLTGGCENYIAESVRHFTGAGHQNSLLYDVAHKTDPAFTGLFQSAFPIVDANSQIRSISPDLIYVHRLSDRKVVQVITASSIPAIRFFHDHKFFCLREHKYTATSRTTCTQPIGARCYACLGFINKASKFPGITLKSVASLKVDQRLNQDFSAYVVASEYMKSTVASHGFPINRIHVNPLFASPSTSVDTVPFDANLVVFAGQMTTGKGVDTLLQSMTLTRSAARLRLCGTGKFEMEYRQLAIRLGLQSRVEFSGKLNQSELAHLYQQAACVAVPSRTPETFGLIGPEAMRFGTPVIATTVGGMNEWLIPEVTGIAVPPNNAPALAEAIDRIVIDGELRSKLSVACKKHYEANFRPERHFSRLESIFTSLAAKGKLN